MTPSIRSRGYLPHWESDNSVYFVTFRLSDSLPRELVTQLRKERETLKKANEAGTAVGVDRDRLRELRTIIQKAERCLDTGLGACHMSDNRVAETVANAIRHFDGERYRVIAWCVMPNHVHVLFSPGQKRSLENILHSWKSYSAQEANRLIGRRGRFWQREYFDHLVRSEASLLKIARYIIDNPRAAGLRNWRWTEIAEGSFRSML